MSHPSEWIGRARRLRSRPNAVSPAQPRAVAPQPVSRPVPPPSSPPQAEAAPPEPARTVAPQPAGGHALYRALMRSHDRVNTRHLDGKG